MSATLENTFSENFRRIHLAKTIRADYLHRIDYLRRIWRYLQLTANGTYKARTFRGEPKNVPSHKATASAERDEYVEIDALVPHENACHGQTTKTACRRGIAVTLRPFRSESKKQTNYETPSDTIVITTESFPANKILALIMARVVTNVTRNVVFGG